MQSPLATIPSKAPVRTSIDLELDLQASETRLYQQQEEITRLKQLKMRLEKAKEQGDVEPSWLTQNEQLQQFLAQADKLVSRLRMHQPSTL